MLINLQDICLKRDDQEVLSHVDFHVDHNDFIYVIGKVGSGKSTLLKALYTEVPIAAGKAEILGYDLRKMKRKHIQQLRKQLGIVFQDFQLMRELTVEQNLDFVLKATGWKSKIRPTRIQEVLQLVNLEDKRHAFPHELSGGEQQRVSIARALLNKPQIILADEPIGNLDIDTSRAIMHILQSIREQGTAIVMVTHNIGLLNEFPGIVYQVAQGKVTELAANASATNPTPTESTAQ